MSDPIARMFVRPAVAWWIYVPCGACNAPRRELCQTTFGPARRPHAARYRLGLQLHATLWLLTHDGGKFAGDVLGEGPEACEVARGGDFGGAVDRGADDEKRGNV